ncbi:FAD-linked oxidoreductase [Colletotrichum siamense]|uniref:FAD-linked oxidoreductase n=1 Tax=Colletotrichum siamense TaxID=690259 RepID=UPI001872E573|nr:FAD-linked oxidoreductase [Colletotrichum siamense]KAF5489183.1 FAD-linked oxidoreductase [Colletotrichum siamense]
MRISSSILLYSLVASSKTQITGTNDHRSKLIEGIKTLNDTLGRRVHHAEPFALACFTSFKGAATSRNESLCAERQENYHSPVYRSNVAAAYMYEQSTICASDPLSQDQCLLNTTDPLDPDAWNGVDCRLGNLPSWWLEVEEAEDVVEAFDWARKTGGKLSIKNSGHSFVLDSSMKDSLLLWTRNLRHVRHEADFIPEGCPDEQSFDVITTGAGVSSAEVYEFADSVGRTILGGYSPTVGISGGWVQGAGHSVLSNVYGLGVDRVIQFTIVTPDGSTRVANRCQNTELFWALRGGGGGTFGVVLDSSHLVEPVVPMAVADIGVTPDDKDVYGEWMNLLVDTAVALADDGWGGHIYGNSLVHVSPLMTNIEEAEGSLSKLIAFAAAHGGHANITIAPNWLSFFKDHVLVDSIAVGNLRLINTRLVPVDIFTNTTLRDGLKGFLREMIAQEVSPYIPVDSPYLFRPDALNPSAVHPGWYDSLWMVGRPSLWEWNSTLEERVGVVRQMQANTERQREVTPGGFTYMNEANPFMSEWEEAMFGENYERLLEVKKMVDPDGLLSCWRCVGWTDEEALASCYGAFNDVQTA